MNGDDVLEVLRQIRDEAKQTNVRLESLEGRVEQTNARLESLEGRVEQTNVRLESMGGRTEFLERRLSKNFEILTDRLDVHAEKMNGLARQQTESEVRLATEVVALAEVTRELRDLVARKLDDHDAVIDLQARVRNLEDRTGAR